MIIGVMPRGAASLARAQIVQGVSLIRWQWPSRVGVKAEREVTQERQSEFIGYVAVEESGKDGHAAANYAGAHFSGAARCQGWACPQDRENMPEDINWDSKPSIVTGREDLGAVSETANRACNSAAGSIIRLTTLTLGVYSHDPTHEDCADSDLSFQWEV